MSVVNDLKSMFPCSTKGEKKNYQNFLCSKEVDFFAYQDRMDKEMKEKKNYRIYEEMVAEFEKSNSFSISSKLSNLVDTVKSTIKKKKLI